MRRRLLSILLLLTALFLGGCAKQSETEQRDETGGAETGISVSGQAGESAPAPSAQENQMVREVSTQDYPNGIGNSTIMETETGMYYYGYPDNSLTSAWGICYYDYATGADIYLCSRPECAHDGNDYCVATSGGYYLDIALYDDALYTVEAETEDDQTTWTLYRVELDGTAKSEVSTLYVLKNANPTELNSTSEHLVIHRGTAFYNFAYYAANDMYQTNRCKCTVVVDLKTGKSEELVPGFFEMEDTVYGVEYMQADGDWLYFMACINDTAERLFGRYNLNTMELEQLDIPAKNVLRYTVFDGRVYYAQIYSKEKQVGLYVYDTETETTEAFIHELYEQEIISESVYSDAPTVSTDGVYLYYSEYGDTLASAYEEQEPNIVHVLTFEGEELGCFQVPLSTFGEDCNRIVHFYNGSQVYAVADREEIWYDDSGEPHWDYYTGYYSCPVASLLDDVSPQWKLLCEVDK